MNQPEIISIDFQNLAGCGLVNESCLECIRFVESETTGQQKYGFVILLPVDKQVVGQFPTRDY